MKMINLLRNKLYFIFLISFLLHSCSTLQTNTSSNRVFSTYIPPWLTIRPYIGIELDGKKIIKIIKDSPADISGLKEGDEILTIDNEDVGDKVDLARFYDKKIPGDKLLVSVSRNGNKIEVEIYPKFIFEHRLIYEIGKILWKGEKIKLGIMVTDITDSYSKYVLWDKESWHRHIKNILITSIENALSSLRDKNFSILDRYTLDKIINEQKFSISEFTDNKELIELGKLSNVTHLLFISAAYYSTIWNEKIFKYEDVIIQSHRLIEVKTGKVICSYIIDSREIPIYEKYLGRSIDEVPIYKK